MEEETWRCVCGARLGDFIPPIGGFETKCKRCGMYNSLRVVEPAAYNATGDADIVWVKAHWLGGITARYAAE